MSEWRCLSCVSVLLTILLDPTHQGPHGSASSNSKLLMTSYSIRSTVVSRYAHTLVTSVLANPHDEAHEAIFDLDLPRLAFISNFTMTIDNKVYVAEIKEKHQAKKIYEKAFQQGNTAAHVGMRDRESEKFRISTRLAAGTEVTFALTYEELLQRHQGRYQLVVSLRPGKLVRKLNVEITVSERTGIAYVHIPPLRTSRVCTNNQTSEGDLPPSTRIQRGETCVHITFSPTLQDQSAFSSSGIMADFTVHYDVVMEDVIGDVQIYGGYFIHYFAPRGLPPVEKNVVFVIDVSGSMFGTKLQQTKKAMNTILSDMQASDYFNIISFSDKVNIWKAEGSIQATVQNIHSAKNYLSLMEAGGWTDINAALLAAASVLNHSNQEPGKGRGVGQIPLVVFLTDGEPTAGVTTPSVILSNIRQALGHRVSLFSLAFGDDADFSLLRRLSLENRGEARRIYEDTDAALQLEGLYEEISKPLLADVHLDYLGGLVGASPGAYFPNYFCGSELVVAGKVQPGEQELGIHLAARGPNGQLLVARHSEEATNNSQKAFGCLGKPALNVAHFIRRLWAYVTIGKLLEARFQARDTTTRRLLSAKALNLSLEYNFVTPLTSLVVVHLENTNEKSMSQLSTTAKTSTVTPSTSKSHGLGAGAAQPASVLRVSSKSRPMKPTPTITAPKKKVPSSKELGTLEKLQLLPESLVESKFVESLNPPVFYTFLTPDKDGSPHWDGNSERILGGAERDMNSKESSVELVKVDGDPHFVVHIPHSGEKICFTLDGRPGDLLQLIEDPKAGLHVSGKLLGAPPRPGHEDQTRTYFQIITITSDKPWAYTVTIGLSSISVQGEGTLNLPWDQPALVKKPQLELHVASAAHLTLQLGPHLNFLILRHQYRHPSTLQLPHLGFYVASDSGLSPSARGLMGQFQHTDIRLVTGPTGSYLQKHRGPGVPVVLGKKLLKESPRLHPRWTSCWLVKRSHVEELLGQPYLAYVL
ncbi:Inter-alpha-trypsin inhibitor heavy chain H5-like protein [Cricetulus griseus]|uniref:Inter-alpha-trypsin inhibitor heavy chain H5-like protein n=1 Tax=Cricetulus griseus TaxID=10029 RepID=G3H7S9_CRIGR|nr:Inter-alpha-trypsin inhibitor heavy chain H5-like protein [Cricetulus griseus]